MIGLRQHQRDPGLAQRFGDASVPSEAEIAELAARHFEFGGARPLAAEWTYARWKPRTALTLAHELALDDGSRATLVSKFHGGGKSGGARPYDSATRSAVALPERGLALTVFPFDRELPGLERCFDLRRLARHVDELELYGPLRMRPGPSKLSVLRYKPERRAVLRLDLRLRESKSAPRSAATLLLRLHAPEVAARVASARREFGAAAPAELAPKFLGLEERTGVSFEEWLDVRAFESGSFVHAEAAGALLARLHATPCERGAERADETDFREWSAIEPAFERLAGRLGRAATPRPAWIHGDFHPDQVAREVSGSLRLLDLDSLHAGDPCEDLASWIADHVAAEPVDWRDAARPLLRGYSGAGGVCPDERELAVAVARALARLAAGAMRRLEHGALGLARERLERALELLPGRERVRAASVERIDLAKDSSLVFTEVHGSRTRWFRRGPAGERELSPRDDPDLPLAAEWGALEASGRVSLLAYRPGRRVTLRYVADDGARVVLKGYRRGRDEPAAACQRAAVNATRGLRALAAAEFEHDRERCAIVARDLGGAALDLGTLALPRMAGFGADLAQVQLRGARAPLERHLAADELRVVDALAKRRLAAGFAPVAGFEAARESLARAFELHRDSELVLAHRDLHDGQLLDRGDSLGWIDFDLLALADDALDAGNFVAHLELRRMQGVEGLDAPRVAALRGAFVSGLGRSGDREFARRLAFYESATFLRLALVYSLRPPWAHLVSPLANLAERIATDLDR